MREVLIPVWLVQKRIAELGYSQPGGYFVFKESDVRYTGPKESKYEGGGYISCDPKEALEANLDDIKKMERPANTNGDGCEHKNLIREIGCYPQCKDCGFIEYDEWEDESDNDRPSAGHDATVFCDQCNNTVKYKDFIKCHQGKECVNSKFDPVNKPKHYNSHPSGAPTKKVTPSRILKKLGGILTMRYRNEKGKRGKREIKFRMVL